MIVRTDVTGPLPRSEALVRATRDLDRGRTTPEAVDRLFADAEREVVALERRLGFASLTAGYLRWPDPFRPFAERWPGFSVGPLTRWFETNTFFRQPVLLAPPQRAPGALLPWIPAPLREQPESARVLLPGPYTFAGLLDNRSGESEVALVHRLGRLLGEEVRDLRGHRFSTFQFSDPLLVVRPPGGPAAAAVVEAYRAIADALGGGTSVLWTFGADARDALPVLDRLPVSVVGIDLADTEVDSLTPGREGVGLGLGVVDPRTTLGEEPAEVARIARAAAERRGAKAIWLGPGAPLTLLPWLPASRKLEALPAARAALADGGRP
jgi:5-methyltetrahydropteroyltriglutamate--homocysteine methyltransferase